MNEDADIARQVAALADALTRRGASVAVAESCTGGWVAKALTDQPGSSAWFGWGVVSYANAAKTELLGVPAPVLEAHGAVSEPVVRAMAEGVRARSGAEFGIATSGVAGPGGGSPDKPVGMVWAAWAGPDGTTAAVREFPGDRAAVRRATVDWVLGRLTARLAGAGEQ